MRKLALLTAALFAMAIASPASAATVPVNSLTGDFAATNSTVQLVSDGVHFGTYANGGALGGSLIYSGFDGHPLSDLTSLAYTFTYRQANTGPGSGIAAPYLRVFLDADSDGAVDNDVILDPTFCATVDPPQSEDLTYDMVGNSVRYSDDGCDGVAPDNQPWATVVAAHGTEKILGLLVSQGNAGGSDVSAMLTSLRVNGDMFVFSGRGAAGSSVSGPQGVPGVNGINGAAGANGKSANANDQCSGNTLRTFRAPRLRGWHFVSARAVLLTGRKRLSVKGRTITLDLRGRPEGNYNFRITSHYLSEGGRSKIVKTERHPSVVCS